MFGTHLKNFTLGFVLSSVVLMSALADEVEFAARVDRETISMEESLVLRLSFQGESGLKISNVDFDAPGFDEVNEHRSSFIRSVYENGQILVRHTQEVVKFLRPKSPGTHTIKNIHAQINGQTLRSENLTIKVEPAGAGTPPPKNYGGGNSGGLRSVVKKSGRQFFARVELDQQTAVKGEQIFATYYLYTQVPLSQVDVDKFPSFKGFLAEQLEMPFRTGRPPVERVVLDGVAYQRLTILRYALYPLQEGKLKVDPVGLRFGYQGGRQWVDDADAFIQQFFQMIAPQVGHVVSDPVEVQVERLPEDGKPASFTGGVGEFTVMSTVNRPQVKANESLTLTIKIEGRGNVSGIGDPKVQWPEGVDVYESKSKNKTSPTGIGEKIVEILLIPRKPGRVTLPAVEFAFFDPTKKEYVTRQTDPIELQVEPGDPSSAPPVNTSIAAQSSGAAITPQNPSAMSLDGPASVSTEWVQRHGARIIPFLVGLLVLIFAGVFGVQARKQLQAWWRRRDEENNHRKKQEIKSWKHLQGLATKVRGQGMSTEEVVQAYEKLSGAIYDFLDQKYSLSGSRAVSRADLKRRLVDDRGVKAEDWEQLSQVLAFAETVRFAAGAGIIGESQAREQFGDWVAKAKIAVEALER